MKSQIKNFLLLIVLTGAIVVSCEKTETMPAMQPEQPVMTKAVERYRDVPIDAVFYNACCDEQVYITGTAHLMITKNVIRLNVSDQQGVGLTSGYSYTGVGQGVETNVFYTHQYDGTLTSILNMSNNNGCSFRVQATFHVTVNANGEVTADFQTISFHCNP